MVKLYYVDRDKKSLQVLSRLNHVGRRRVITPGRKIRRIKVPIEQGQLTLIEVEISCLDCGTPNPANYMVTGEVWEEAGFSSYKDGICCINCLKRRLNRPLRRDDFISGAGYNDIIFALDSL